MNFLLKRVVIPLLALRAKKYLKFMNEIEEIGVDLEDSKTTLEMFLEKTGFCLDKGILEKIDKDDFVEIYDPFKIQIFRTFNIYKYSTYSWDELFSKRVDELYERPDFYNRILFKACDNLCQRKSKFIENVCPSHFVNEKKEFGSKVYISYKFMAPVYDTELGNIVGVIVCEKLSSSMPH